MTTCAPTKLHLIPTEAVVLRPSVLNGTPSARWPLLALILDDRYASDPRAAELFALLDRGGAGLLPGEAPRWSVLAAPTPALRLSIDAPAAMLDVDIVIPTRRLLEHADLLATANSVALTSQRHARWLTPGTSLSEALSHVVQVGPMPAAELAELAELAQLAQPRYA